MPTILDTTDYTLLKIKNITEKYNLITRSSLFGSPYSVVKNELWGLFDKELIKLYIDLKKKRGSCVSYGSQYWSTNWKIISEIEKELNIKIVVEQNPHTFHPLDIGIC